MESKPRVSFEFEVERIIGVSSDGKFQVQWAPAWVSKFHLVGCEHLIQDFLNRQAVEKKGFESVINETRLEGSGVMSSKIEATEDESNDKAISSDFAEKVREENMDMEIKGCTLTAHPSASNNPTLNYLENAAAQTVMEFNEDRHEGQWTESVPKNLFKDECDHDLKRSDTQQHEHSFVSTDNELMQKCHICGLEIYLMTRSTGRTQNSQPYSCDHCPFLCAKKCDLKRHMRTHTGERPFSCETCGRAFAQKCHLNRHIRMHTGVKPYSCEGCGHKFADMASLKNHSIHCSKSMNPVAGIQDQGDMTDSISQDLSA